MVPLAMTMNTTIISNNATDTTTTTTTINNNDKHNKLSRISAAASRHVNVACTPNLPTPY